VLVQQTPQRPLGHVEFERNRGRVEIRLDAARLDRRGRQPRPASLQRQRHGGDVRGVRL
jgi:hypothetical protein